MIYQKTLFAFIMLFFFSAKITKAGILNDSTTSKSIEPYDSTKRKIAFANNNVHTEYYTIPANVIYPSILKENVEETKDYVEKFVNSRKDYVLRMYSKGKASFPKIITAFKKYNLPEEYRVLIALESAFNGNAVSGVGAVGY